MRYWWVNQSQTFRQEIDGGYLWSPKRNENGNRWFAPVRRGFLLLLLAGAVPPQVFGEMLGARAPTAMTSRQARRFD